MSETMQKAVPVALLYGEQARSAALRGALEHMPVELVCDRDIASFSIDQLEASGARVVLLSLDAVLEDRLDEVYEQLDGDRYRVIFDDAEISNGLDGWERARWQRHLAAKLCDNEDWDPPRPADARPVDVPAAAAAVAPVPAAAPSDVGGPAFPDADEIALALGLAATPAPAIDDDEPPAADAAAAELDFDIDFGRAPEPGQAASTLDTPDTPPALAVAGDVDDEALDFALDFDLDADLAAPGREAEPPLAPEAPAGVQPSLPERGDGEAFSAAADEAAAKAPGVEPDDDFHDLDDARLQAELDALADADDPLAALAALATDHAAQRASEGSGEPAATTPVPAAPIPDDLEMPADEPAAGSAAATSDGGDAGLEEPDWDALSADLSAVFDSETLNSLDAAGDADAAPIDALASEHVMPVAEADAPTVDMPADDAAAPELTDAPRPTQDTAPEAPAAAPPPASDDAEPASSWSDSSSWGLVDDDEPYLPAATEAAAATSADPAIEVPGADDAVHAEDEASEFKLELLDPVDYLQPEAPADITTELFRMPSLVPQAEAVAPTVDGHDVPRDRAAAPLGKVVVLGASLGGPDAVRDFLAHLPPQLPATLLLVLHLGREFLDLMVSQLSRSCALPVHVPVQAERAAVGEVLVVPAGARIHLARDGHLRVDGADSGSEEHASMDHTMTMAAETFGADTTAIVFSGMASDAREGAQAVAAAGGQVWVQDPDSCVVSTMVDAVMQAGLAQFVGTPQALAEHLIAHLQETDDAADG